MDKVTLQTIESEYKEVLAKYTNVEEEDYSFFLNKVKQHGTEIFDVPSYYITDEMISAAVEATCLPIYLMTRHEMEDAISRDYVEKNRGRFLKFPVPEKEHEDALCSFYNLMHWKHGKYLYSCTGDGLYTFVDFYGEITASIGLSGMDTMCYYYLYIGHEIPIIIEEKKAKTSRFILSYSKKDNQLIIHKTNATKYNQVQKELKEKLTNYYSKPILVEYRWQDDPLAGKRDVEMFPGRKSYDTFNFKIEGNGAYYDISQNHLFQVPEDVEEFVIPETVSTISPVCFRNHKKLKTLHLSGSITLPIAGFYGCDHLERVVFEGDEKSYTTIYVEAACFAECSNLKEFPFFLLNNYAKIPCAFSKCVSLKEINTDNHRYDGGKLSLDSESSFAFFGCSKLESIPKLESNLSKFRFAYCESLKEIEIIWCSIPKGTFYGCSSLQTVLYNNDGYCDISEYAFGSNKSLKHFYVNGEKSLKIKEYAFDNCISFEEIIFRKKQEDISAYAFEGCPNLIIDWGDRGYYTQNSISANDFCLSLKQKIEEEEAKESVRLQELDRRIAISSKSLTESAHKILQSKAEERLPMIKECVNNLGVAYAKLICHIFEDKNTVPDDLLSLGKMFCIISGTEIAVDNRVKKHLFILAFYCYLEAQRRCDPISKDKVEKELLMLASSSFYDETIGKSYIQKKSYLEDCVSDFTFPDMGHKELVGLVRNHPIYQTYILHCYLSKHLGANIDSEYNLYREELIRSVEHAHSKLKNQGADDAWIEKAAENIFQYQNEQLQDNDWASYYIDTKYFADNVTLKLNKARTSIKYEDFEETLAEEIENELSNHQFDEYAPYSYDDGLDDYGQDEDDGFGRYAGSYAQDEMGYSDDDIDTIFDGDSDAYWNID